MIVPRDQQPSRSFDIELRLFFRYIPGGVCKRQLYIKCIKSAGRIGFGALCRSRQRFQFHFAGP